MRTPRNSARREMLLSLLVAVGAVSVDATVHAQGDGPLLAPLDTSAAIGVFIAPGPPESAFEPHDRELAQWALEAWRDAASGRLAFTMTEREPEALIRVYFIAAAAGQYGEMRRFRIDERYGAAVFVRPDTSAFGGAIARRAAEDPLFRDTIVFLTCLHELGHALGLVHTAEYDDIMYAFGYGGDIYRYFERYRERLDSREDIRRASALAAGDVAQLRSLYPPPQESTTAAR